MIEREPLEDLVIACFREDERMRSEARPGPVPDGPLAVQAEAGVVKMKTRDGRTVYAKEERYYEEDEHGTINPITRDEIKGRIVGGLCGRHPICSCGGATWEDRENEENPVYVCPGCAAEKNLRAAALNRGREPCVPASLTAPSSPSSFMLLMPTSWFVASSETEDDWLIE